MSDFNSYRIVNPAAADVYFDSAGTATTADTQPKVDGGSTIIGNGTNRDKMDALALGSTEVDTYGSQVIETGTQGVNSAFPGVTRNFATMTAGQYIMRRGGANTLFVAGTADNTLRSGASDYAGIRRSINARTIVRAPLVATAIRAGQWNVYSGNFTAALTSSTSGLAGSIDLAGTDEAATPTAAKPGELVYFAGSGITPAQWDYEARTTN